MKNTREIAREYRMGHWAEIMRRRVESGMSIKEFCAGEGMHVNRYHYWQRRLRTAAVAEIQSTKPEAAQLVPAGWTQIKVGEENTDKNEALTIEIGKCRVGVEKATDMELLTKVCKALTSIC